MGKYSDQSEIEYRLETNGFFLYRTNVVHSCGSVEEPGTLTLKGMKKKIEEEK